MESLHVALSFKKDGVFYLSVNKERRRQKHACGKADLSARAAMFKIAGWRVKQRQDVKTPPACGPRALTQFLLQACTLSPQGSFLYWANCVL